VKEYAGPHGHEVLDVAIAKDNASFASCGGDRTVFLWDVASGQVGGACERRRMRRRKRRS
jgi:mitogen-activated protein kinase organizer 1